MANLDGFILTHTYETVDIPEREQADRFLPPYETDNRIDFDNPKNMAFSAGPDTNYIFKFKEHQGVLAARQVIRDTEKEFAEIFGRKYSGLIDTYLTDDADYILVTLGSIAGLCRETADKLRESGVKWGYDLQYLMTGLLNQHPRTAIEFTKKDRKDYAEFYKEIVALD
jgi:pyruvate ferredoxin oxidoreductase alpha subunit